MRSGNLGNETKQTHNTSGTLGCRRLFGTRVWVGGGSHPVCLGLVQRKAALLQGLAHQLQVAGFEELPSAEERAHKHAHEAGNRRQRSSMRAVHEDMHKQHWDDLLVRKRWHPARRRDRASGRGRAIRRMFGKQRNKRTMGQRIKEKTSLSSFARAHRHELTPRARTCSGESFVGRSACPNTRGTRRHQLRRHLCQRQETDAFQTAQFTALDQLEVFVVAGAVFCLVCCVFQPQTQRCGTADSSAEHTKKSESSSFYT